MDRNNLYGIGSLIFGLVSIFLPKTYLGPMPTLALVGSLIVFPILALILGLFSIIKKKFIILGIIGIILVASAYIFAFMPASHRNPVPPFVDQMITYPTSADNPFFADREIVVSNKNPVAVVVVSFYNKGAGDASNVTISISDCIENSTGTDVTTNVLFDSITNVTVQSKQFREFHIPFGVKGAGTNFPFSQGDFINCSLSVKNPTGSLNYSASVIINILE